MSASTIKREIWNALDNLRQSDFRSFCSVLQDRREEPRVLRRDVEGKSREDVADRLVSVFTEAKALLVTLSILRQIRCNEEALGLDTKTRALLDNGDPIFRKTPTGELEMNPSPEALKYAAGQSKLQNRGRPPKHQQKVEDEAKVCVHSEGGDPSNNLLVLSRFTMQFGKYRDQTFKWLLENDLAYVAFIMAAHHEEKDPSKVYGALKENKDSLAKYANGYPEVLKVRSCKLAEDGQRRVGFGCHKLKTLKSLYESKDCKIIRYVNYLRGMKSECTPGSNMEVAIEYILLRDKNQPAAATIPQSTSRRSRSAFRPQNGSFKNSEGTSSYYRPRC